MKSLVLFTLVAFAPLSVTTAAVADSNHGHGGSNIVPFGQQGPGAVGDHPMMAEMMQMMMQMHAGMMQGDAGLGFGRMSAGPGMGMMSAGPGSGTGIGMGSGMMGGAMGPMMQAFDADADGSLAPDELRQGLLSQLEQYDADGDGTLALAEFQDLFLAMTHEAMVDRFQHLDADGDGAVTADEMTVPADGMARTAMGMTGAAPMPGSMPMQNGSGDAQDN